MLWKSSDPSPRLVETFDDPQTAAAAIDGEIALKVRIHQRLLNCEPQPAGKDAARQAAAGNPWRGRPAPGRGKALPDSVQTDQLIEDVLDELLGLGRSSRC